MAINNYRKMFVISDNLKFDYFLLIKLYLAQWMSKSVLNLLFQMFLTDFLILSEVVEPH